MVDQTIVIIQQTLGFTNIRKLGNRYFYKDTPEGRIFLIRSIDQYMDCPLPKIIAACLSVYAGAPRYNPFFCEYTILSIR